MTYDKEDLVSFLIDQDYDISDEDEIKLAVEGLKKRFGDDENFDPDLLLDRILKVSQILTPILGSGIFLKLIYK
jgi:hypothetical protein